PRPPTVRAVHPPPPVPAPRNQSPAALVEASAELARHLLRGGADPREALDLLGPALVLSCYGEEGLLLLGVGERTARQRLRRVKELVAAANASIAAEEAGGAAEAGGGPAQARRVTRTDASTLEAGPE
ncbi:hypothetical protein, partial [Kineococcus glutinatus]|uniref:hypothetical protein n=1 Tax=Kineococcus glutinatus TaxID=1070872 RepID=UPI0031EF7A61